MRLYSRHDPVGFTYYADCYCRKCGENLPDIDPEGNDKHPIFSWETSEISGWGCAECGEIVEEW